MKQTLFACLLTFLLAHSLAAQDSQSLDLIDLSPQKVFIENQGQLSSIHTKGQKVLFGATAQGAQLFFTNQGVVAVYEEYYLTEEQQKEVEEEGEFENEMKEKMKLRYHYATMTWENTSSATEVKKVDETSYYFTYPNNRTGETIITRGYTKIIYKNIYKNIDIEYVLPEKGGIKYNLILHPGAHISDIKLSYKNAEKVFMDSEGNVQMASDLIGLTEHAPVSFYEDGTPVASSFKLNSDNSISFSASYDSGKTLIIDPWVTLIPFMPPASILPGIQPVRTGFHVCYDNIGNVYVYGGASPYHVLKFSPGGTLLWDTQFPDPIAVTNAVAQVAGDMEVDKRTGSVYVSEGYGGYTIGASIYKLNSAGVMIAQMNGLLTAAFSNNLRGEISRLRLDYCTNLIHMTCGGVPTGSKQVAQIDTAFSVPSYKDGHITVSNNGDHDVCLMALDPKGGFMYMNFNKPDAGSPDMLHDNEMHKVSVATYNPSAWINPGPIYTFQEISCLAYAGWSFPTSHRINMFNGMVCGNNFLFTNDGKTVKKWNKSNGTLIGSVQTGGKMFWSGGIDLDNCENLYVGTGNTVKVYDSNLNLINTLPLPDTSCYDLKVDVSKKLLYACGNGYVAAIPITILSTVPQFTVSATPLVNCSVCNGTATALASVALTCDTLSFSYSWMPGGQNSQSITGLCAGTYSVQISWSSLAKCNSPILDDTILVVTIAAPSGAINPVVVSNPVSCFGANNGSASVSTAGGTSPYTFSWSNGQSGPVISGLSPGSYSVSVTDAGGCTGTQVVLITEPTALQVTHTPININCNGAGNGSVTLNASGGTPAYSYTWSNGQNVSNVSGLQPGNYQVITTDGNGCTDLQNVTITEPPALLTSITAINVLCSGNTNGSASVTASGGTSGYSYVWNNGQTTSSVSNLAAGNYSVVITDANACSMTQAISILEPLALSMSVTPVSIYCGIGTGSASVISIGGTPAYTYLWSNGQFTGAISGLAVGNYSVNVTDGNGCIAVQTFSIASSPPPVAAFAVHDQCQNMSTVFADNSVGSPNSWSWDFGDGTTSTLQNPQHNYVAPGTYTVTLIVSLAPGCSDTIQHVTTVHPTPIPLFSASSVCEGNTTSFSDLSSIAQGSIVSWLWNFGNGTTSTVPNPSYVFSGLGSHSVTLTVTSANGCTGSITTNVNVYSSPMANFCVAPLQQPISNPVFYFCDQWSSDVTQWTWNFGDGNSNTFETDPQHSYASEVTGNNFYSFEVCLNVQNQYGCWDTICKTVEIIPEFTFYIPNTFTPNGDHNNEFFFGKGLGIKEYAISIFDRWGNRIWDCSRADSSMLWDNAGSEGLASACQWDGAVQKGGLDMNGGSNQLVQEDVYVWKVELTDIFNRRHDYIGNVNVVK